MFNFIKKKNGETENDDIVILRKTAPGTCGGTDAYLDKKAPNTIVSEDMISFDVTSALGYSQEQFPEPYGKMGYVSAFAEPAGEGTFVFLSKGDVPRRLAEKTKSWAVIKKNVFPELDRIVRENDIAKNNGFHSTTHGLPENFGGGIYIEYASGEKISISDNQSPVLSVKTAVEIARFFDEALKSERVELPDVSSVKEIRFSEERKNGGFTKAVLTLLPDGTGVNAKKQKFDSPEVYETEKPVDADTVSKIKSVIVEKGLFAQALLPEENNRFSINENKTLTFVLEDGAEITVKNRRVLPKPISGGFFDIELEMTTKH